MNQNIAQRRKIIPGTYYHRHTCQKLLLIQSEHQ